MDDRLTSGISADVPLTEEQTAQLLRRANLLSQLSNILCGKELATLEELLQGASQVKAELAKANQERDAAVADLSFGVIKCDVCKHGRFFGNDCIGLFGDGGCSFEWRGVYPENTEVQDGQSNA